MLPLGRVMAAVLNDLSLARAKYSALAFDMLLKSASQDAGYHTHHSVGEVATGHGAVGATHRWHRMEAPTACLRMSAGASAAVSR